MKMKSLLIFWYKKISFKEVFPGKAEMVNKIQLAVKIILEQNLVIVNLLPFRLKSMHE